MRTEAPYRVKTNTLPANWLFPDSYQRKPTQQETFCAAFAHDQWLARTGRTIYRFSLKESANGYYWKQCAVYVFETHGEPSGSMKKLKTALVLFAVGAGLVIWSAVLPIVGLLHLFAYLHN